MASLGDVLQLRLSRRGLLALPLVLGAAGAGLWGVQRGRAAGIETPQAFLDLWSRTDLPVLRGVAPRTWMWGQFLGGGLEEPYHEAPGGVRGVQYTDKARMEITRPDADPSVDWYVSSGLLVRELLTCALQVGDGEFEGRDPATSGVAGDDGSSPSYAALGSLMDAPPAVIGRPVVMRLDPGGVASRDQALMSYGVVAAVQASTTNHSVASVFHDFMTSAGVKYHPRYGYFYGSLFADPYYATGLPLTEPYWTTMRVSGVEKLVLVQAFERRCLTWTPDNPAGWRVEAGNAVAHYYQWRYGAPAPAGWFPDIAVPEGWGRGLEIGGSVQGRPIQGLRFGTGPTLVVVLGGIHTGEESNTVDFVQALSEYLRGHPEEVPAGLGLILIPALNVDGLALGTRVNARGVDLNRNWPKRWQPAGVHGEEIVSGGAEPLSEPETAALYRMLDELRPSVVVSWHSRYYPNGAAEGNDIPLGADGRPIGKALARAFADVSGGEYLPEWTLYPISGQLIDAMEDLDVPALDVELATAGEASWEQNLAGFRQVIAYVARLTRSSAPDDAG